MAAPNTSELSKIPQLHFKAMSADSPLRGKYSIRLSGMRRLLLSIKDQVITVERETKHYEE